MLGLVFVYAALAVHQADVTASPQQAMRDVASALIGAVDAVGELRFHLAEEYVDSGGPVYCSMTLSGEPRWRAWRYQRYGSFSRPTRIAWSWYDCSWDGATYRILQDDGMGIERPDTAVREQYMGVAGIWLAAVGLAGETDRHGELRGWRAKFAEPDRLTLGHVAADPSIITVTDGSTVRYLDSRYGYMPVAVELLEKKQTVRLSFSGYALVGPVWLPHRYERHDPGQDFVGTLSDIAVNDGMSPETLLVPFPFGTSVLMAADIPRIAGTESIAAAESALLAWLQHDEWTGRMRANTATASAMVPLDGDFWADRTALIAMWLTSAALMLVAWPRSKRPASCGAFVALAIVGASGWDAAAQLPAANDLIGQRAGAAGAHFLARVLYERPIALSEALAQLDSRGAAQTLSVIATSLKEAGVHVYDGATSLDELERWPFPSIVVMKRPAALDFERFAVLIGARGGRFTVVDPNPFGALRPMTRAEFAERWTGRAVLTAPVPIEVRRSLAQPLVISGVVLILCAAIACFRFARARRLH